jgi:hypothetical protein
MLASHDVASPCSSEPFGHGVFLEVGAGKANRSYALCAMQPCGLSAPIFLQIMQLIALARIGPGAISPFAV